MLVDLLRARAAAEPGATAFAVVGGDSLTYGAWDLRSDDLGQDLLARGVGTGDRVVLGFGASQWIDHAVAYAGVHKAGAVPVLVGPQAPATALRRAVAQSGACGVVTPGDLEAGGGGGDVPAPSPTSSEVAHISYRYRPLQAFRPTSTATSEMLAAVAEVDDVVASVEGAPFLHAFGPTSDGGVRALWLALGRRSDPVITLPAFEPRAFCTATAPYPAASWSLAPATAGWILDSGALEDHDLAQVVRLIVLDRPASPALRDRLAAGLPAATVVTCTGHAAPPNPGNPSAVPVAFSQEGMLWHEVFAPGSQNLPPLVRRYRGPLDVAAMERALAEIVRRHEPLRTTFEVRDGRPVQVVAPAGEWELGVLDLTGLDPGAQDVEVATLLAAVGRPFDLVVGPMFEASLVRLGSDDHLVVLRVHHSVYDDWSVGVFRRELSVLYRAFAAGEPSPLEELPLSFSDFSRGQHRRLTGPVGEAELAWWKEHLAGAPLSLQLPIDDPDRSEGAPQSSAEPVSIELPGELSTQLRALARRERTTLFMTMLAGFEVLVHRYTGQSELLAASVVANRNRVELEQMVGCFTKKVLVRLDGSGDPTFAELLPRVRTAVVGALSHQDLPFETVLQGALGASAAAHGLAPQVAVMFQGVTPQTEEVVLPGLATSGYDTSATTTRTHFSAGDEEKGAQADTAPWGAGLYLGTFLILSVIDDNDGVTLSARGAFHGPSVERLLATFETLLGDIVAHPTKPISELRLLSDDDRVGLVRKRAMDPPPVERPNELFEARVARHPTQPAIVEAAGCLTYAELDARADVLAVRLRERGVGPDAPVGLGNGGSVDSVVAVLAAWKAGAGYMASGQAGGEEVVIGHREVVNLASGLEDAVLGPLGPPGGPRRVCLSGEPGDGAFLRQVVALLAGHTLYPAEGPGEIVSGVRDGNLDVIDCSPQGLQELVGAGLAVALQARTAGPTPALVVGTPSPIDRDTWRVLRSLPSVRAHHLYGPPECSFGAAVAPVSVVDQRLTLGRPLGDGVAMVLDRHGEPVAERVIGELVLDGSATFDQPFRTGQLARRLPGGSIELLGAAGDIVDLRGFPVDRARIAGALEGCPGVAEIDIVLQQGVLRQGVLRQGADGDPHLVARVVPVEGAELPSLAGLQVDLWAQLPGYAWPAALEVAVDAALKDAAPRETEMPEAILLASLWAEAKGVERIEVTENYWQSFSFLEAVSRARNVGVALSDQDVTRNRTVSTLATTLATASAAERPDGMKTTEE